MVLHEEGFIVCCSLCDTYFVVVTGVMAPSQHNGREGKKQLDERNEKKQLEWAARRWTMLRCPTCVELLMGMQILEYIERHVRDSDSLTPLSLCFVVSFEESQPPPLYLNHHPQGEAGKPKWRLASGVGPAGLELDNSRSGRLWKPSLRPFGIDRPRYEASEEARSSDAAAVHAEVVRRVEAAFEVAAECSGAAAVDALAEELHAERPLFACWKTLEERLAATVQAHRDDEEARRAMESLAVAPPPQLPPDDDDPMMVGFSGFW
jgi:hypothetical protein